MTPIEKLENEFPAHVLQIFRDIANDFKADYDERDFDYFEYIDGYGNDIEEVERGTQEWHGRMESLEESAFDAGCPFDVTTWERHLTGEREATHQYPGWYFTTYYDAIKSLIEEELYVYALEGVGEDTCYEWEEDVGSYIFENDVLDQCVDRAVAELRQTSKTAP